MPSRIIDFDALWNSDKLRKLPVENRVDYLWIYGIADANGSFELNPHAIVANGSANASETSSESAFCSRGSTKVSSTAIGSGPKHRADSPQNRKDTSTAKTLHQFRLMGLKGLTSTYLGSA
jgi:hypothetical protein